jgi:hypothetical protein
LTSIDLNIFGCLFKQERNQKAGTGHLRDQYYLKILRWRKIKNYLILYHVCAAWIRLSYRVEFWKI